MTAAAPKKRKKKGRAGRIFNLVMVVLGVGLFVGLLLRMDTAAIGRQLSQAGWTLAPAFVLYVLNLMASVMGWRETVQPGPNRERPPFLPMLRAFWAGHAINGVGIGGAGEVTKATILSRTVRGEETIASLVIFAFINMTTIIVTTMIGAGICVIWLDLPGRVIEAIFITATVFCGAMLLLRWVLRRGMAGRVVGAVARLPFVTIADLERVQEKAAIVDERIHSYRANRPASFRRVVAWSVLARLFRALEFAVLLYGFLPDEGPAFLILFALLTQTVMTLLSWSAAFIPGKVGVLEGGAALLFDLVGLGPELGMSVAILRRVRRLIGIAIGLVIAAVAEARGAIPRISEPPEGLPQEEAP